MMTVEQISRLQKLLNPNGLINWVKRVFGITIKKENLKQYIAIALQQEGVTKPIADFIVNRYDWFIATDAQIIYNQMLAANIFSDATKCYKIGNTEFCFTNENLQNLQYVGIAILVLFLGYNFLKA